MGRQARTLPKNEGRGWPTENLGTATTASSVASIPNYGLSVLSSATNTWVLDAPEAGCFKVLYSASGSSGARTVKLHPSSSLDSIKVGLTATEIAFHSTDHMLVGLIGVSSVQWAYAFATTGALTINTTGIVFQAS